MADQELIDSIVPNEALGIKRKPSIVKIGLVATLLATSAFLGYSLLLKTKPQEENPPLIISGTIQSGEVAPTTTEPSVPTEPLVTDIPVSQDVNNSAQVSAVPQAPAVQQVAPIVQNTLQPQPVAVAPQPVAVAPQPVAVAPQPVAVAPQPSKVAPISASDKKLSSAEKVVSDNELKKIMNVEKKKKSVKGAAPKTNEAKADEHKPGTPIMEEGVTQEEIIVFQ